MHFWDPSQWDEMCFECQRIRFQWKKCPFFWRLPLLAHFRFFPASSRDAFLLPSPGKKADPSTPALNPQIHFIWQYHCLTSPFADVKLTVFSKIMRLTSQSTSLWCFHKELIQSILIWRFHNPYSFRARLSNGRFRLSNEGWIFWIRFCNDLREAPCVNARGPLYSQIWHH